ncbi:MAG: methyl-accepting chemotaxis protein, partial [Proteobacteria bacterium]|nr:methyl-accepting chemotaxis protein [Pseudomonadota bacterium]
TKGLIHYHTEKQYMNKTFEQPKNVIDKTYSIKPDGGDSAGILHIGIEKKIINNKINAFIFGGVLISVFILCLILPLVYLLVSNRIMKPLKKITVMLTDIAEGDGDLTKRLERVETQDEFEVLSKKFNKFVDKIHEIIMKVGQNTSNVSRSANELYAKTEEMKNVIVLQTNHTIEVASAVVEMTSNILEVARNANNTKDEASKSSDIAKMGEKKTIENMEIMDSLVKTVETSSSAVNELGMLSDLIDEIIKVIEDIADQTNLLALNAAIEAARAGDAGRGFAVVADEVRKLAEKTATATKDIGKTVVSIKNGTINAVSSMEKSKEEVLESKNKIYEAKNALTEIVNGADLVMAMVTQIASASSQQSTVSEEIGKSVDNIKESIILTSSATEHNVKLAGELQQSVKELNNVIGMFRV